MGGLLLALLLAPSALTAQQAPGEQVPDGQPVIAASPPLPAGHWAVRAAARAEALGLVGVYQPAQRSVPRAVVGAALREAARRAPAEAPALAPLAEGWLRRFVEEFPEAAPGAGAPALLGSAAAVGYERGVGRVAPGAGLFHGRTGVTRLEDEGTAVLGGVLAAAPAPWAALVAEPRLSAEGAGLPRWDVVVGAGALALSVGEQPVGYGPARGGGIVLSGAPVLPRVEVQTARPLRLPGPLRALGPVSGHTFLTRLSESRHPGDPYHWGVRGVFRPHPRFTVGVNRASIFGGDSVPIPTTPKNVGRMLLGLLTGEFENQVVSAEFRYRAPTERVLPLTLYLEWGADDAAGAWWDVPGRVVGAFAPALPGLPGLSLGAEYASFATPCCGNPPWYLHSGQIGGWAAGDSALGHPLGGEGRELLLYGGADLLGARLRVDGRAFRRERGREGYDTFVRAGNQFAPERAGGSTGAALDAAWRSSPGSEVALSVYREAGEGWTEREMRAQVRVFF